jgi:nicotinate-nucleotide pyrophosphorylase (carboxylating)
VVAGLDIAGLVFRLVDSSITLEPEVQDGARVGRGMVLGSLHGATRGILLGERTALNILQRMSGIATLTRRFVDAVAGTRARITDTRKTVPGLRALDKRAVVAGGGVNHRFGLDDMVLIKDNHVAAAGGITPAVQRCRDYLRERHIAAAIEVETTSLDEVREALACPGIARIMLDNFPVDDMKEAVRAIGRAVETEASGGVTLESVRAIAETGVDFISVGALTHSVTALDISLELSPHV